ncbi:hypothetical protein ES708_03774 [subsurface metagenome]
MLTVITYSIIDPPVAICSGDSALIYGAYRNAAGTYYDSLITTAGRDSVHSTALIVNPIYSNTTPDETICDGDSVMIFGTCQKTDGTYYDSSITANGCDSITTTTLIVNLTYNITDPTVSICSGDSALIYGAFRAIAGIYYNSLTTIDGCDSVHSTILIVDSVYSISDPEVSICDGDTALIYVAYRTAAGTYYNSLTTVAGCDSVHSTVLTIKPTYSISDPAIAICSGYSTLIYGTYRTTAGTYYDSLTKVDGCDSIHLTVLSINPNPSKPTIIQNGNTLSSTTANSCSAISASLSVTISSIREYESIYGLKIYPNPNTGEFNIVMNITQAENLELKIVSNLGQVLFKEKLRRFKGIYEKQLDLNKYPVGIYNLLLINKKGVINKQIIIIEQLAE